MKKNGKLLSLFLALIVIFSVSVPTFAAASDTGFTDVNADSWYAEAVVYCRDNGIMSGTTGDAFEPEADVNRAMLATVLWHAAGSPSTGHASDFADTDSGAWYIDAVSWAVQNSIVSGYGNGLFGTNDPVTREQIAAILWRYAGSPATGNAQMAFVDVGTISTWAANAVSWAYQQGVIGGRPGNLFDPQAGVTRADVAMIMFNYLTKSDSSMTEEQESESPSRVLVAYFSRTGTTETIAQLIHESVGGDIVKIETVMPYPEDYQACVDVARIEKEENARPELSARIGNMNDYDVIFIGYPIWFSTAPMAIGTFLESYDTSGKTVIPFCTSGSGTVEGSMEMIESWCPDSVILKGLTANDSNDVLPWLTEIGLLK